LNTIHESIDITAFDYWKLLRLDKIAILYNSPMKE